MGKFYRGSLALRVLVVSIAIFALPLLIYFLIVIRGNYETRMRETVIRLIDLGRSRAVLFEETYDFSVTTIDVLVALAEGTEVFAQTAEPKPFLQDLMTRVVNGSRFELAFYVTDVEDRWIVTASSDETMIGEDLSAYHFVEKVAVHGESAFLAFAPDSFDRYLYVVKQIDNAETGEPVGMLAVATLASTLIDQLVRTEDTGYTVNVSLLDDNIVFASGNPDLLLNFVYGPELAPYVPDVEGTRVLELVPIKGMEGAARMTVDGVTSLVVQLHLRNTHLMLLLDAVESEVFGQESTRLLHVLGLFFVIFVLGGWLALWVTQRMSVPWRKLGDVMQQVSEGDLTARFEVDKMGFEINDLGTIFNDTIDSLCDQMAQAEAERVQKETLRQELNIGYEIQLAILPAIQPSYPGAQIAARYVPAKEVGGDFYDVFVRQTDQGEQLVLTVADAAGKGISACLYALGLRSMLRSACVAHDDLTKIVRDTNKLFCKDTEETGMFVTVFSALFDPGTKQLTYTSCGHNPIFLQRASGELEMLQTEGLAMGVQPLEEFDVRTVQLQTGDLVILYTDGVTEAHNARDELYGEERLAAFVKEQNGQPADHVVDGLLQSVDDFRGTTPPFDDLTALVFRVL